MPQARWAPRSPNCSSAFAVAKEVRTATEIGAHSISMAAAAVPGRQPVRRPGQGQVLFVGAGEMIELAPPLCRQSPKHIAIANRTLERGKSWPAALAARSCAWPICPSACTNSTPW